MKRRLAYFVGGTVLVWLLVNGVGRLAAARFPDHVTWAERETVYSAVAVLLCLIPTTLTLLWSAWAFRQTPDLQLVSVLGGTGVRMFFVLAAGLALWAWVPYFGDNSFWTWVMVFYLFTLGLEVALLAAAQPASQPAKKEIV